MKKRFLSAFLALALCLGLAVPAFAANALTTNFSNLTIYDVDDGQYALRDVNADVTALIIGRVTCGYTTGTLQEVAAAFNTLSISNGRVYLLDVDQPTDTVSSYARQKPSGAHIAWSNNQWTYTNLFWEIVNAVEPGVTNTLLPAVCVLDRDLQPVYYASHNTYEASALTAALKPYAAPTTPTQPDQASSAESGGRPFAAMEQQAYQAMIALKGEYPEGMHWTDDDYYGWKGGIYSGGGGCAGFAFLLSDAAFGDLPARKLTKVTLSDVRVGDILRINNNTHSVIVLEVHDDHVVIAEGNYNSSIHWGRTLSASTVASADYLLTRYPKDAPAAPAVKFTDVPANAYYAGAVAWAVQKGITNGTGDTTFSPKQTCTHGHILTFLWRAAGKPESSAQPPVTMKGDEFYYKAVKWAAERGMIGAGFDPNASCTRADAVRYIWYASGKPAAGYDGKFTDVPASSPYAAAVAWAVANGVTNGTGNGTTFTPNKVCDRGTIVTFLHRAYVPEASLTAK